MKKIRTKNKLKSSRHRMQKSNKILISCMKNSGLRKRKTMKTLRMMSRVANMPTLLSDKWMH